MRALQFGAGRRFLATMNRYKITKQLGDGTYGSVLKVCADRSRTLAPPALAPRPAHSPP